MYRSRSKSLLVFLIYVAGVVAFSKAQASALTKVVPEQLPSVQSAPRHADLSALARAYEDLLAAESSLSANPDAAASFGPMLRAARERLEAGLAAEVEAQGADAHALCARPAAVHTGQHPHPRPRGGRPIWV